jgi:hypothetical protein
MNQNQRAKWEKTRAKGMWHFVLVYGVLCWGGFMAVAMSVVSRAHLGITIPIYLFSGFVFGLVCWLAGEYKYRKSSGNVASS